MKNTVFFDLFGTLVYLAEDSKPFLKLARRAKTKSLRESLNLSLMKEFNSLNEFSNRLDLNCQKDILDLEVSLSRDINSAKLYPEVFPVLDELKIKGYKLALISNLATPYKKVVKNLGLEKYFDTILYSCECGFVKPNPQIYESALKNIKSIPTESLMVGDNYKADVDGPFKLGIESYLLRRHNSEELKSREMRTLNRLLSIAT